MDNLTASFVGQPTVDKTFLRVQRVTLGEVCREVLSIQAVFAATATL